MSKNIVAKALGNPLYRKRVVKSKKNYSRKVKHKESAR